RDRAGANVLARDAVGDVDNLGVGAEHGDHAVADTDEIILEAVVGQECDHRLLDAHRAGSWQAATMRSGTRCSSTARSSPPRARASRWASTAASCSPASTEPLQPASNEALGQGAGRCSCRSGTRTLLYVLAERLKFGTCSVHMPNQLLLM